MKKTISNLEEKLAEKETQKKCFSSISTQTEEEEVSEISFSRNPVSNTEESYTEEASHTEDASATDDTRFVKSNEKSKGKQNRNVSNKSVSKHISVTKTPSKPITILKRPIHTQSTSIINKPQAVKAFEVCSWFISSFMSKSKYS